jgi:hypothetical protein
LAKKPTALRFLFGSSLRSRQPRHFEAVSPGRNAVEGKLIDSRPLRLLVNIRGKRYNERGSTPWIVASLITIR